MTSTISLCRPSRTVKLFSRNDPKSHESESADLKSTFVLNRLVLLIFLTQTKLSFSFLIESINEYMASKLSTSFLSPFFVSFSSNNTDSISKEHSNVGLFLSSHRFSPASCKMRRRNFRYLFVVSG